MRLGILQLKPEWGKDNAVSVANRFELMQNVITDLELTPFAQVACSSEGTAALLADGTPIAVTGASAIQSQGFTVFTNTTTCQLSARATGYYCVQYSVSGKSSAANAHIEVGVAKNTAWQWPSSSHIGILSAAQDVVWSGSCILELQVGDTVELRARCIGSAVTLTYEQNSMVIFRL